MKTTFRFALAAILIASTLFSSCGKYEDGPKISLASKKGRLTRAWTFEKSIDGATGAEFACTSGCTIWELKKDGAMTVNGTSWTGVTWQLSSDKEKLETITTVGSITSTSSSKILRLTSKELWLKDETSGDQDHYISN